MALGWDAVGDAEGQDPTPGQSLGAHRHFPRTMRKFTKRKLLTQRGSGAEGQVDLQ